MVRQGLGLVLLSPGSVADAAGVAAIEVSDGPVRTQYLAWDQLNWSRAPLEILGGDEGQ